MQANFTLFFWYLYTFYNHVPFEKDIPLYVIEELAGLRRKGKSWIKISFVYQHWLGLDLIIFLSGVIHLLWNNNTKSNSSYWMYCDVHTQPTLRNVKYNWMQVSLKVWFLFGYWKMFKLNAILQTWLMRLDLWDTSDMPMHTMLKILYWPCRIHPLPEKNSSVINGLYFNFGQVRPLNFFSPIEYFWKLNNATLSSLSFCDLLKLWTRNLVEMQLKHDPISTQCVLRTVRISDNKHVKKKTQDEIWC